ncbi:MAG: hypothetical protein Q7J75_02695 [Rhodoferax sp.]|nr:hypothetical protein [Rhodoferax sp.]
MKFAILNSLTAREIAQIVIRKKIAKRAIICNQPNVDLRDSSLFDIDVMAKIFHLSETQVRSTFLLDGLPNSQFKSSENLRWCVRCASHGFHAAIFQMNAMTFCPIHSIPLLQRCSSCKMQIPYRLRADVTKKPFCCPHCGQDMAPWIRYNSKKLPIPRELERIRVERMINFFQFEETNLSAKLEIDRKRLQLGQSELVFARADNGGYLSRYVGFVSHVLHDMGYSDFFLQIPIGLERVERINCGQYRLVQSDDDDSDLDKPWWPQARDSINPPKVSFESQVQSIHNVYRTLRRHLWRHVLKQHQHCIVTASRHFWWHMDGEITTNFCPIAQAFIKWRMLWEGCGTPRYLFAPGKKEPFGLLGWIAARPSPCPVHWSKMTQLWIVDHIFGNACIESFRELLINAQKIQEFGKINWAKERSAVNYDSYWAVAGCDCKDKPAIVYVRCPIPAPNLLLHEEKIKTHREKLHENLTAIRR